MFLKTESLGFFLRKTLSHSSHGIYLKNVAYYNDDAMEVTHPIGDAFTNCVQLSLTTH